MTLESVQRLEEVNYAFICLQTRKLSFLKKAILYFSHYTRFFYPFSSY